MTKFAKSTIEFQQDISWTAWLVNATMLIAMCFWISSLASLVVSHFVKQEKKDRKACVVILECKYASIVWPNDVQLGPFIQCKQMMTMDSFTHGERSCGHILIDMLSRTERKSTVYFNQLHTQSDWLQCIQLTPFHSLYIQTDNYILQSIFPFHFFRNDT